VKQGGHLTKPGWSKPHTHFNPTNLALFRRKITLYRFNQGAHSIAGGLRWEQGSEPPEPPHFNHCVRTVQVVDSRYPGSDSQGEMVYAPKSRQGQYAVFSSRRRKGVNSSRIFAVVVDEVIGRPRSRSLIAAGLSEFDCL